MIVFYVYVRQLTFLNLFYVCFYEIRFNSYLSSISFYICYDLF